MRLKITRINPLLGNPRLFRPGRNGDLLKREGASNFMPRGSTKCSVVLAAFFIIMCFLSSAFAQELMQEQAVEYFKEAVEAQKAGDIDYAISLYTKAIYARPNYAKAHNNLGTAYAQKGDISKAEEEYGRAVSIDSNYSIALKNLAIIYAERKDYEKFYEYWKRATGLDIYSPFLIDDEE